VCRWTASKGRLRVPAKEAVGGWREGSQWTCCVRQGQSVTLYGTEKCFVLVSRRNALVSKDQLDAPRNAPFTKRADPAWTAGTWRVSIVPAAATPYWIRDPPSALGAADWRLSSADRVPTRAVLGGDPGASCEGTAAQAGAHTAVSPQGWHRGASPELLWGESQGGKKKQKNKKKNDRF